MKKFFYVLLPTLIAGNFVFGQEAGQNKKLQELPKIYVNKDVSTHFVSPEPIQYVDISTKNIVGDLPIENVLRLKPVLDSIKKRDIISYNELGVVTIVGQKFMAQYNLIYSNNPAEVETTVQICPEHLQVLDNFENSLSNIELKQFSLRALKRKASYHSVKSNAFLLEAQLNNVYSVGEYILIDVSFCNHSYLKYDIDQIRFKIEDKKVTKASNIQSVEIKPVFELYKINSFQKKYRNIIAFKKFTYPGNKVLSIEMSEKQISGRIINLQVDYSDILNADSL